MATLWRIAAEQRAALLRGEAEVAAKLGDAYAPVRAALDRELAALEARIDLAVARGEAVSLAWLYQHGRVDQLAAEVQARMDAFARQAERTGTAGAREAARQGVSGGLAMVDAATPPGYAATFVGLRSDALDAAVAQAQKVAEALPRLGREGAAKVREVIVDAVGRGRHPREAARAIARAGAAPLNRALTIARTEQLRAYRTGSVLTYQHNAAAVEGWVWLSAADSRTCAACFAMHGSRHPLDEPMESHPNCRCSPAPIPRSWDQLGADSDGMPQMPLPGETVFRRLPDREKRSILGPAGLRAYRAGEVTLADFVAVRDHPLYGRSISQGGVRHALEAAGMR